MQLNLKKKVKSTKSEITLLIETKKLKNFKFFSYFFFQLFTFTKCKDLKDYKIENVF